MSIILGKNIFIYNGNSSSTTAIIAAAKSCTISKKIDLIERASSTQAVAKEYVTGRYEWEVSLDHLVTNGAPFQGVLAVGQTYTVSILIGSTRMGGQVICTQADISGAVGSIGKGSVKFKGTGRLQ